MEFRAIAVYSYPRFIMVEINLKCSGEFMIQGLPAVIPLGAPCKA
jgi:hypothetical protein